MFNKLIKKRVTFLTILPIISIFLLTLIQCEPPITPPQETRVENVIFSPSVSDYRAGKKITLSCSTEGAEIYYTTDPSTDLMTNGNRYTSATSIVLNLYEKMTIRAYAKKGGLENSAITTATYTGTGKVTIDSFETVKTADNKLIIHILTTPPEAKVYYTTDGSTPSRTRGNILTYKDQANRQPHEGALLDDAKVVRALGVLENWDDSDLTSDTFTLTLDAPKFRPAQPLASEPALVYGTKIKIEGSLKNCDIYYKEGPLSAPLPDMAHAKDGTKYNVPIQLERPLVIKSMASTPGWLDSPQAVATYNVKLPGPTFSIPEDPALTYNSPLKVTLDCAVPDAVIYYTTDGNTPTTALAPYQRLQEIPVNQTTTIKAIAVISRPGWEQSDVSSATYHFSLKDPDISPKGGDYYSSQTVQIRNFSDYQNATVYYTTDGTDPTNDATLPNVYVYTGPIQLNNDGGIHMAGSDGKITLKVLVVNNNNSTKPSNISTEVYTFRLSEPTTTVSVMEQYYEFPVKLSSNQGAEIYYTINGDSPATGGTLFNRANNNTIQITKSTTLKAIAKKANWVDSNIVTWDYILKTANLMVLDSLGFQIRSDTASYAKAYAIEQTLTFRSGDPRDNTNIYYMLLDESSDELELDTLPAWVDPAQILSASNLDVLPNEGSFTLTESKIILAYAKKDGWAATTPIAIRCRYRVPTPTIDPTSDILTAQEPVTISNELTNGVYIKYTLDGSDPSTPTSNPKFCNPGDSVIISKNVDIYARAYRTGWASSQPLIKSYSVKVDSPVFKPDSSVNPYSVDPTTDPTRIAYIFPRVDAPTDAAPIYLQLLCSTIGAAINYTRDVAPNAVPDPDLNSQTYFQQLKLTQPNTVIKARARDPQLNFIDSDITSAIFKFKVLTPKENTTGGYDYINEHMKVNIPTVNSTVTYTMKNAAGNILSQDQPLTNGRILIPADKTVTGEHFTVELTGARTDWVTSDRHTFTVSRKLATPTIDVMSYSTRNSGAASDIEARISGSGSGPQFEVTINHPINNASLYYTTDGSTPSAASSQYTRGTTLKFTSSVKLQVIAIHNNWYNSELAVEQINICLPPTIDYVNPTGGGGGNPPPPYYIITNSMTAPGENIYYSVNNGNWSLETRNSFRIENAGNKSIRVKVVKPGYVSCVIYSNRTDYIPIP